MARDERDMFGGLLELAEIPVGDAMVHRTKMRTLDADLPPDELIREVLASPYTRMPLWRGDPDNIIGMLHTKDLFRAFAAAGGDASRINAADIALEAWFIPEATTLRDQLQAFLRRKTAFGPGRRRIWRRARPDHARGHHRGDRRRHQGRARRARARRAAAARRLADRRRLGADPRPQSRDGLESARRRGGDDRGLVIHEARAIPEPRQTYLVFHGVRFEVLRRQRNRIASVAV